MFVRETYLQPECTLSSMHMSSLSIYVCMYVFNPYLENTILCIHKEEELCLIWGQSPNLT